MRHAAPLVLEHYWFFAILLLPRLAEACPMCASQQPGGLARTLALGVMLLLPFAIVCVVFGALRRADGLTSEKDSTGQAATGAERKRAGGMRESKR